MHPLLQKDVILVTLCKHLDVQGIVRLAQTCRWAHRRIFDQGGTLWSNRQLIFQPQDQIWHTHPMIHDLVPRLPRDHGLEALDMTLHPGLGTLDLFVILDQYAHCVHDLQLTLTSADQAKDLVHHLQAIAVQLLLLESQDKIPLTFYEYTRQTDTYVTQANQFRHLLDQQPRHVIIDPPFECLQSFTLTLFDHDTQSNHLKRQILDIVGRLCRHPLVFETQKPSHCRRASVHSITSSPLLSISSFSPQLSCSPSPPTPCTSLPPSLLNSLPPSCKPLPPLPTIRPPVEQMGASVTPKKKRPLTTKSPQQKRRKRQEEKDQQYYARLQALVQSNKCFLDTQDQAQYVPTSSMPSMSTPIVHVMRVHRRSE
ncbi:hypothetical protein DM01DRAFT_1376527 [Hesseltinella vesiculosa]|uniref:F-box domain-containing protein n=1 Tax=Hesseltinella vesiculosa TaxID=101127 RepID=A0A1X2GAN2_9FUNG|nr:hypothetical protein DM01DRAFT_1376527 [Hesseltinella vesiculosa]